MGESVDPETLFKTLSVERLGEILDQALQVTANVSTVYSRYLEFQGTGQNMSSYQ